MDMTEFAADDAREELRQKLRRNFDRCIVQLEYGAEGDSSFGLVDIDGNPVVSKQKKQKDISPISIRKLTPIQMPHIDIEEVREGAQSVHTG